MLLYATTVKLSTPVLVSQCPLLCNVRNTFGNEMFAVRYADNMFVASKFI